MDETTKTNQDSSEKTSSDSKDGTTSDKKGKTLTEEQVQKMLSDAKAEFGRERSQLTKERDTLKSDFESTTSRLNELQKRIDDSELEGIRDNPDLVKAYQKKQDLEKKANDLATKERELTQREAQLKADMEAIATDKQAAMVTRIAVKHGLNIEQLEALKISDEATLETVAAVLATSKPEKTDNSKPDSALTSGGLTDIKAREKANQDFNEGKISEKKFLELTKTK